MVYEHDLSEIAELFLHPHKGVRHSCKDLLNLVQAGLNRIKALTDFGKSIGNDPSKVVNGSGKMV